MADSGKPGASIPPKSVPAKPLEKTSTKDEKQGASIPPKSVPAKPLEKASSKDEKQGASIPPQSTAAKPHEKTLTKDEKPQAMQKDEFNQGPAIPLHQPGKSSAVEVDTDEEYRSDADSLCTSSIASETTSLTPSVFDYVYANGRRYASDRYTKADYFLPNDEMEQNRLDLYHHIFLLIAGGKLHTAPLDNPQRVLDIGTGTGIWAIDFADDNPQAEVIGVDISPIQPVHVPSNCQFQVDDVEDDWTWPANHFDYIHLRSMSGSIQNWERLLKQCYDRLKPGGILEYQDYGGEVFFHTGGLATKTPVGDYVDIIIAAAEKLGRPLRMGRKMKSMFQKMEFIDTHETCGIWPLGDWPKDKNLKQIGRWGKQGTLDSLEPFALQLLTNAFNMTVPEIKELCEETKKDFQKASPNKYYAQAWFVWGRKPYA